MAKRRAVEPLAFHVPRKRPLPRGRRDDPGPSWAPPELGPRLPLSGCELPRKRKREDGPMAEPQASPSKRSGDAAAARPAPEGAARPDTGETKPPAAPLPPPRAAGPGPGARGDAARPREPELTEEFWQYNTFQYWRNPLPSIDLSEIERLTEPTLPSKDEGVEIDMES